MSDEIHVKVNSYGPGRPLSLVYFDPVSGRKKAKSSGTTDWREAERLAGELEKELRAGRYAPPSKVTWQQFVERYTAEKLPTLCATSRGSYLESLRKLDRLFHPDKLCKVNAALLSRFQAELRKSGIKETTIAHHLRGVKASLRWAERQGMLAKAPAIEMPKGAKGQSLARSRAVTTEEYERMLMAAVKVCPHDAPDWQRLLGGAWLGGLRRNELAALSWEPDAAFSVDLTGKRPCFRILAEGQKSGRDEILPLVPDFAELLLAIPEGGRVGLVFKLFHKRSHLPLNGRQIGRIVGDIGRKAGVVTNKADGKYAGLHDLRRGFCTRWSRKVMPAVLQRLARHRNISTTMSYYVSMDAADLAEELWATHKQPAGNTANGNNPVAGNTSGNNGQETTQGVGTREST